MEACVAYSTPSQPGTTRRIAEHLDRVWLGIGLGWGLGLGLALRLGLGLGLE